MINHFDELEGIQDEVRRVITMLRENEAELIEEGFDVDGSIAEIHDQFSETVKAYLQADQAHNEYLHACADLADAEYEYFQGLCALIDPLAQAEPQDSLTKQWLQLRPLLSRQTPANN